MAQIAAATPPEGHGNGRAHSPGAEVRRERHRRGQAHIPERRRKVSQSPRARRGTMDFYEVIRTRRSVRKYRPDPIPEEVLARVLEAARIAPSGSNRQPTRLIVVTDPGMKLDLAGLCHGQTFLAEAPRSEEH